MMNRLLMTVLQCMQETFELLGLGDPIWTSSCSYENVILKPRDTLTEVICMHGFILLPSLLLGFYFTFLPELALSLLTISAHSLVSSI